MKSIAMAVQGWSGIGIGVSSLYDKYFKLLDL